MFLIEIYELVINREDARYHECIQNPVDTTKIYIEQEHASSMLDKNEAEGQRVIQQQYADDLIDQNGVSTRAFVKENGVDFGRRFFHEVFFDV